ncbi:M1 family metallopeptidase [Microtetraspora sp. AC03309]|uniref:M1 family metallopeptidase n=1 Tax=Microtetraspora sp. AC03309 TaxID=2779376 RepID=UPI001E435C8D|nr:M1 family metallopeptidase [Microtetraspora sp. AC03309]
MMAARRLTTTFAALALISVIGCAPSEGAVTGPGGGSTSAPGHAAASPGSGVDRSDTVGAPGIGDPTFPLDGNGGYDVGHYTLKLSYDPASKMLAGSTSIQAKAVQDLSRFDLDLHGFTVSRVTVGNSDATFTRDGDELVVTAPKMIAKDAPFTVTVDYSGVPDPVRNSSNLGSYGFIPTPDGAFVTAEPDGAKTWFPSNDHPSDKATYDFEITVPAGLTAIANGEQVGEPTTSGGKTTFVWREKHPMASYLATMTTGKFDVRTGTSPGGIPVYAATDPKYRNTLDLLYTKTAQITDYWTTVFGPYPFSSTGGVVDAYEAGYALENQTKPIYGGFAPDSGIIAHELAHQWFGDSLSIKRWQDLWLNEGFASYAEWLWSEHSGGSTADQMFQKSYADTANAMWSYPPGKAQRDDLFNDSVYTRGAMTLHALRKEIGDDAFFTLIKKWAATYKYGNVTTDEFIAMAEKTSGKKLGPLFDAWLFQPTRPALG